MNLILPVAGKSTRFPNTPPKWKLTHPTGELMITKCISGIKNIDNIYIGLLKEHLNNPSDIEGLQQAFIDYLNITPNIMVLDMPTNNQPETVYNIIKYYNITSNFLIKDCDNYFEHKIVNDNYICTYDLHQINYCNASNKSYITSNENGYITNIAEKCVISNVFCCGGYSFKDANQFVSYYKQLENETNLYISHIIYKMILDGYAFKYNMCDNYLDWGTIEEWNIYRQQFQTLFVDIDGVLFENQGKYFVPTRTQSNPIMQNIENLRKLYLQGKTQIILTTSRTQKEEQDTIDQLKKYNVPYDRIIFDIMHSKRIIINDYSATNPYPSCNSINIARDSKDLYKFLS